MNIARRVFLRFALSRDPHVVEKSLNKLENLLKEIGKGDNYHAYGEAVDAFRDVVYFIGKVLGETDVHKVEHDAPILALMSKNPYIPDKVTEIAGEDAFQDAIEEVKALKSVFEKAQAGKQAAQPKFVEQRKMLLDGLKANGWDVKEGLNVPHATTRDFGGTRLWFKAQAIYMNDLETDPRNYKNTHSLTSDIREYKDVAALVEDVARMREIQRRHP